MFESLGDRLQNAINKIKGYGKITEDNISDVIREIRLALLEADVNYKVVKEFINSGNKKPIYKLHIIQNYKIHLHHSSSLFNNFQYTIRYF